MCAPQDRFHGDFEQPIGNASRFSLFLTQADAGEFRIREKAERDLPASRHMVTAREVVADHPEIINANVGKLRAASYLTDCPNAGCGRLNR